MAPSFKEEELRNTNITTLEGMSLLISRLCGQEVKLNDSSRESLVRSFLSRTSAIDYEQFNELLLLFNQSRVSPAFFEYFFTRDKKKTIININELKYGVTFFRGMAMICYGNFRFAYKKLSKMQSIEEIRRELGDWCRNEEEVFTQFSDRPDPMVGIDLIPGKDTWCLGYVTPQRLYKDVVFLYAIAIRAGLMSKEQLKEETALIPVHWRWLEEYVNVLEEKTVKSWSSKVTELLEKYKRLHSLVVSTRNRGKKNTLIYLTWDYMDVYLATSMRYDWEFAETANFISKVFDDEICSALKIRYFDPTQSYTEERIDKGLVEGLMLKRAKCTVYLAQEIDTLGKDSELASTLAQGKPVIVYVPTIHNLQEYVKRIISYPLEYFRKRLYFFEAEGFYKDYDVITQIAKSSSLDNPSKCKLESMELLENFKPTFSVISDEENDFRNENLAIIENLTLLIASTEAIYFDRRALLLSSMHPLAIQVDINTGVANGLLILRREEECKELLRQLLLNTPNFKIVNEPGLFVLREEKSGCPFRVVTKDEDLTNSFWNFYLPNI